MRTVPNFTDTQHVFYTMARPPDFYKRFQNVSHFCSNISARERHALQSLYVFEPGLAICEEAIQDAHAVGQIRGKKVPEFLTTQVIGFLTAQSGWLYVSGTTAIECKQHTENTNVATLKACAEHCFNKALDTSPQLVVVLDVPQSLRPVVSRIYSDTLRDWTASNAVNLRVTFLFTDTFFGSLIR